MIRIDAETTNELAVARWLLDHQPQLDYELWRVHEVPDDPELTRSQHRSWSEIVIWRKNGKSGNKENYPASTTTYSTHDCIYATTALALVRDILEALCEKSSISLDSSADPGKPARNYELMDRLGIGHLNGGPRD